MLIRAPRTDYQIIPPDRNNNLVQAHPTDKDKLILKGSYDDGYKLPIPDGKLWLDTDITVTMADLDTGTLENGKDYNIYGCYDSGQLDILFSLASTYPTGYDADSSLRLGGFHTICANIGTISGHALSNYLAGHILPLSVWDFRHRAKNLDNRGMVWDAQNNFWVQIYMASDDGANGVQSVYGATALVNIDWNNFVTRGANVGMRLLTDPEFQIFARGCNEETNITGSTNPVTTGGHVDTASRRMINTIGCEDPVGVWWTYLDEQTYQWNMGAGYITATAAGATATVYHAASPGGNPIYLKFDDGGRPYLCSNLATATVDKWVSCGTNQKLVIKHDANAATGGLQIYMNRSATEPGKILVNNTVHGKNVYIPTNYLNGVMLQIVHDASASSNGVALYYDDGADNRLEATFGNSANNTFDTCYFSPTWNYLNLPGVVGSYYGQGDNFGDVKLLAGGAWYYASVAGSRCRTAYYRRADAYSSIGARFAVPPL